MVGSVIVGLGVTHKGCRDGVAEHIAARASQEAWSGATRHSWE